MSQDHVKDLIYDYLDGELDAMMRSKVESHLDDCVECQLELASWRIVKDTFFEKEQIQLGERFVNKVMSQIQAAEPMDIPQEIPSQWGWLVPAFGMAAVALALYMAAPVFQGTPGTADLLYLNSNQVTTSTDVFGLLGL